MVQPGNETGHGERPQLEQLDQGEYIRRCDGGRPDIAVGNPGQLVLINTQPDHGPGFARILPGCFVSGFEGKEDQQERVVHFMTADLADLSFIYHRAPNEGDGGILFGLDTREEAGFLNQLAEARKKCTQQNLELELRTCHRLRVSTLEEQGE